MMPCPGASPVEVSAPAGAFAGLVATTAGGVSTVCARKSVGVSPNNPAAVDLKINLLQLPLNPDVVFNLESPRTQAERIAVSPACNSSYKPLPRRSRLEILLRVKQQKQEKSMGPASKSHGNMSNNLYNRQINSKK